MKIREVEYSRTFNLGQYESERIGLKIELDDTDDLDQAFTTIKTQVLQLHMRSRVEEIKHKFSHDWLERLEVYMEGPHCVVKPKHYLSEEQFKELASLIRDLGGEYVSAGKNSHFKISVDKDD